MTAYYNEHDKYAAQWLRNLIAAGHIADGVVDERDIRDVHPSDLVGFTQCHFFAGIGVWSYALRLAGWTDDRPVWTGSCPCQPFSDAGAGAAFDDERHLWPHWFHLIERAKPRAVPVFGEQVASKDGLAWLDLVHADLERAKHAVGAVDLCAAGVGAPHIRQRFFFVADAGRARTRRHTGAASGPCGRGQSSRRAGGQHQGERACDGGAVRNMADPDGSERAARDILGGGTGEGGERRVDPLLGGASGELEHTSRDGRQQRRAESSGWRAVSGCGEGFWSDAEWIACRDGKARPVEPGTFPLAHGATARVGRLRAYGNAINAEAAAAFIGAYLETT